MEATNRTIRCLRNMLVTQICIGQYRLLSIKIPRLMKTTQSKPLICKTRWPKQKRAQRYNWLLKMQISKISPLMFIRRLNLLLRCHSQIKSACRVLKVLHRMMTFTKNRQGNSWKLSLNEWIKHQSPSKSTHQSK